MDGYKISIITPTHNTPDELFKAAFDSVMSQTLDEAHIEWVIVVHNSSREHLEYVRGLCSGHDGIKVLELNNDKHTASSPRNHALENASGRYITFLDADDRLTPECLGTLISGMEETGAQVGKYRSEKTEEDDGVVGFLDNRVRFSQTKPLICLHHGDPDVRKLMTMANMMMSCQVVERSFLEKYGTRFRENIRIYEDVVFNMECISHADTIAVFPQLIGYIYYMHHGSTMQELKVPEPEEVLSTCRDIAFQLNLGLESGLYMRYLFFGHMKQIADMMEASEKEYGIPDEIRNEIRDMLGPFFDLIEPPEPEKKFLGQEEIDRIMARIRFNILGPERTGDEKKHGDSTDVLVDILRSAEDTEIGETWGFEQIRSHEAYASQVPVNVYDSFAPMIELMCRIGESDILFSDPISGYAITSGTLSVPRKIPYTERTMGEFEDLVWGILTSEEAGTGSSFVLAASIRGDRPYADSTYPDSICGAVLQKMRHRFIYNSHTSSAKGIRLTGPEELFFHDDPTDPRYLRLLFALLDRNVTQIVCPFTWALLDTMRYLELNHEKIVRDIEHGTLRGAPWLSTEEREVFRNLFKADPERARELRLVFERGFDVPVISGIWPECRRVVAGGSAGLSFYSSHLRRYTGDLTVTNGAHVSSEAVIGTACDNGCYRLVSGESFFEFIPLGSGDGEKNPLKAEDLSPGCLYELLVTTRAGLYRYRLGDVIRVERMEDGIPVYRLLGRHNGSLINNSRPGLGLRFEADDITSLLESIEERFEVTIEDYCVELDEEGYIRLYVEPYGADGSQDKLMAVPKAEFERAVMAELGADVHVRAFMLQTETQFAFRDKRMYLQKTAPDQIKPVHMLNDNPAAKKFFDAFIIDEWD